MLHLITVDPNDIVTSLSYFFIPFFPSLGHIGKTNMGKISIHIFRTISENLIKDKLGYVVMMIFACPLCEKI